MFTFKNINEIDDNETNLHVLIKTTLNIMIIFKSKHVEKQVNYEEG